MRTCQPTRCGELAYSAVLYSRTWVQVLKREGIECIVAPYEADAQLAYLALTGDVDAVITEDSDLLPYGCPTASVWRVALC